MKSIVSLLTCVLLVCVVAPLNAEYIANGGFEAELDPLNNWTVGNPDLLLPIRTDAATAHELNYYLQFQGRGSTPGGVTSPNPGYAYQDITLLENQAYSLSFFYQGNSSVVDPVSTVAELTVIASDVLSVPPASPLPGSFLKSASFEVEDDDDVWHEGLLNFGTKTSTLIRIWFQETSENSDGIGIRLDSVSVTAVPEPSALVLCFTGLVSLVGLGWRRRRQR